MREPVRDVARGKWRGILSQLGVAESYLTGKHGPCPACGGKDRFRFTDFQGAGGWICNQCGAGDGISLIMAVKGCDFQTAAQMVEDIAGDVRPTPPKAPRSEREMHQAMKSLWLASTRVEEGDHVWKYLRGRTGAGSYCRDLRSIDRLRHKGPPVTEHPGMLAIVRAPGGSACQIHRTYLTRDGQKAAIEKPKQLMPGGLEPGACVHLFDPGETLGIAEGIETALSCAAMWNIPVWSALSAGNMVKFTPPPGVKKILIFGDNDLSFTGQHAANALASVLWRRGLAVEVFIPDRAGADWNDIHREESAAA
ncbi:toprim domain-containing protein [Zavarzinia compransoris]|uniref:toprim domain-containing protein n=1 Tax=Zavarzinia marina TaxID=2911065 RepID=UPI001F1FDFD7|nr:toprim domain-containing protein [Zavarzinia marina]MCF4166350.1 toprim domain-containing protein [Zavarzinia marina]